MQLASKRTIPKQKVQKWREVLIHGQETYGALTYVQTVILDMQGHWSEAVIPVAESAPNPQARDTVRLDYAERALFILRRNPEGLVIFERKGTAEFFTGNTIREVIDKAMKESPEP